MWNSMLNALGSAIARYLSKPLKDYAPPATCSTAQLAEVVQPGDILLVEGGTRLSQAIKYLTQSTWSHAAFFVGNRPDPETGTQTPMLVEADLHGGVRFAPLSSFTHVHTRICRPIGLLDSDLRQILDMAVASVGQTYDLRNVIDLARYLLPTPPVPVRWRRRMIGLGSGDPTKAICSTLIAQIFQSIRYPILPEVTQIPMDQPEREACCEDLHRIRNHSLFTPRDFDVSPYFQIIKPGRAADFDYRTLRWEDGVSPGSSAAITGSTQ